MTRIVPVLTRDMLAPKHPRQAMPRDMRIELAVLRIAEMTAGPHMPAASVMRFWLEDGTTPINSIRSAYRSLS